MINKNYFSDYFILSNESIGKFKQLCELIEYCNS